MIAKKLNESELVSIVESVFNPIGSDLSSADIDRNLLIFCLNCPDPVAAMDLVIEAPRGSTSTHIAHQALTMPNRAIDTWDEDELALDHPLRHLKLES